jgi:hypothetical protein
MVRLSLHPHAHTPTAAVRALHVTLNPAADGALHLTFDLDADAERLVLPPRRPAQFSDGLWRHTCFELFAAGAQDGYREFNFSPSSCFAMYDFRKYRTGMMPIAPREPPSIEVQRGGLSVRVRIPAELTMVGEHPARTLGIAAVIEERGGALSCWALHHPGDEPDFHHREGFVVSWPPREVI